MKKFTFIFFITTVVFVSCGDKKSVRPGWSDSIPVRILVVGDSNTPAERNYVGEIGSAKEVALSFPLGGTLTKVLVKNGDQVRKGQLLAEVDPTTAKSFHDATLATLRQAEDAYRRLEAVHKENGISDVRWMQMETDLEKARQAEVSARKHLENCSIVAPFSGVVSCSDHHVGQDMRPMETFARLLDMNEMRVNFSVPEQEVGMLSVGTPATATVAALNNRELRLRVSDKSLVANPLGHTYKVHASVVDGDEKGLLPDMVAKVHVIYSAQGGIIIPSECVTTMPEGPSVWVLKGGVARHAGVQVGDFVKCGVVVTSGLSAGDSVIVLGQQKMFTGAKVKVME